MPLKMLVPGGFGWSTGSSKVVFDPCGPVVGCGAV